MSNVNFGGLSLTSYAVQLLDIIDKHYNGVHKEKIDKENEITCVKYDDHDKLDKEIYSILKELLSEYGVMIEEHIQKEIEEILENKKRTLQ